MASGKQYSNDDYTTEEEPGKLFVGGLSWQTTEEKLQKYFGQYGDVVDVLVMKNTESGQSRGFGFVTFSDHESVKEVLKKGPHHLDGRAIDPKPCNTKAASQAKRNAQYPKVFMGGLPHNVTESELRTLFSKFGKVMDVNIMWDHERNKCRGFGFLSFENNEGVDKCVMEQFVYVNGKKVEVKRAEPQDGRSKPQWNQSNGTQPDNAGAGNMPSYQNWAGPSPGYGYGGPQGAPMPYNGWGAPQWGPGYAQPTYAAPPYGAPPMPAAAPYGNWNWNMPPQGPPVNAPHPQMAPAPPAAAAPAPVEQYGRTGNVPTSAPATGKPEYSNGGYAGYGAYSSDTSGYNQQQRGGGGYSTPDMQGTPSSGYGSAPGPQRGAASQQGYHPYRRV